MKKAINAVKDIGLGARKATSQFNLPYSTLWDKLKQCTSTSRMGRRTVFTKEIESANHLKMLANMLYGLTKLELRRRCYEFVEKNSIQHPFNTVTKLAGKNCL
jgi:hypothetical protein